MVGKLRRGRGTKNKEIKTQRKESETLKGRMKVKLFENKIGTIKPLSKMHHLGIEKREKKG